MVPFRSLCSTAEINPIELQEGIHSSCKSPSFFQGPPWMDPQRWWLEDYFPVKDGICLESTGMLNFGVYVKFLE